MSAPVPLTDEEIRYLRWYAVFNRRRGWWQANGMAGFLPVPLALFALSQFLPRWLPGHLESLGLALCRSHRTLHRGVVWWPEDPGLQPPIKLLAGLALLGALFTGGMIAAVWVHDRRAQKVADVLQRIYPEIRPEETVRSPVA